MNLRIFFLPLHPINQNINKVMDDYPADNYNSYWRGMASKAANPFAAKTISLTKKGLAK